MIKLLEIYKHFLQSLTFKPPTFFKLKKDLIYFGLGGSAIAGDLIKIIFPDLNIEVRRTAGISNYNFNHKSLLVASWSGKTQETIRVLNQLIKLNQKPFVLTSNGQLEKLAQKAKLNLIKFPQNNFPPRFNFGYFLASLIAGINFQQFLYLQTIIKKINPQKFYQKLKPLAQKILPYLKHSLFIYSDDFHFPLAQLFKIKINENLHLPCHINFFPELFHNEILSYNLKSKKVCLIFHSKTNKIIEKEIQVFKKLFRYYFKIIEINLPKEAMSKIIFVNLLADTLGFIVKQEKILENESLNKIKNLIYHETNNKSRKF